MKILSLTIICLTIIVISSEKYFAQVYCVEVRTNGNYAIARFQALHASPPPAVAATPTPAPTPDKFVRPSAEITSPVITLINASANNRPCDPDKLSFITETVNLTAASVSNLLEQGYTTLHVELISERPARYQIKARRDCF